MTAKAIVCHNSALVGLRAAQLTLLFHPLCAKRSRGGLCFADVLFFKDIFTDFCQTKYLNVYRTDLHEICRICRTLAADERSEVIFQHMKLFFDPSKDVAVTTNFMGKIDLHFTRCSSRDIR